MPQLGIAATADDLFDKQNFSIGCGSCGIEFPLDEILAHAGPQVLSHLPDGESIGAEKFGRGREDYLIFGKNLGTSKGIDRNRQMRRAVEGATPGIEGLQLVSQYYELKAVVGLPESKPMKSSLEMTSRKIKTVELARKVTIPEPVVDQLGKLIRKGVSNAEARRPTTSRDRRLIVETIMARMGLWPE
jgi:ribosomal protein L22